MFDFVALLAADPVVSQKLETIEDYLFWGCVALGTAIASLAGWIATRIKAHAEEKGKLELAHATEKAKLEKIPEKVRAEERKIWAEETKTLLDKHAAERREWQARIKELSDEKDDIYQQSVEMLERWFERKKNGKGGGQ